jgi:hypothetical protein
MIATRLHIKRHSTSTIRRPSPANIQYSSDHEERGRRSRLTSKDIQDHSDIGEGSEEPHEGTKVEKFYLYFKLLIIG